MVTVYAITVVLSQTSQSRKIHVRHSSPNWIGRGYLSWQLRGLRGCDGVYVVVTGSTWLLRGLRGCYEVYVPPFSAKIASRGSIRDGFTEPGSEDLSNSPGTSNSFLILRWITNLDCVSEWAHFKKSRHLFRSHLNKMSCRSDVKTLISVVSIELHVSNAIPTPLGYSNGHHFVSLGLAGSSWLNRKSRGVEFLFFAAWVYSLLGGGGGGGGRRRPKREYKLKANRFWTFRAKITFQILTVAFYCHLNDVVSYCMTMRNQICDPILQKSIWWKTKKMWK